MKADYAKQKKEYPCYNYYYEALFTCHDQTFEYMLELAYYRKMNGLNPKNFSNFETMNHPISIYDTPSPHSRITYTY